MIPSFLHNSWGISGNAELSLNTAWITKARVFLSRRCFLSRLHPSTPHLAVGFSTSFPSMDPSWGRAPRDRRPGAEKREKRDTQKEGENERKSIFFWAPLRKLVQSRKELIAVKACQSPDSRLQSPGTNVIIANKLKSLTVTIASEKTPTPSRKNQWQERKKKNKKGTIVIPS